MGCERGGHSCPPPPSFTAAGGRSNNVFLICGVLLRLCGCFQGAQGGLGPKLGPPPNPHVPWGLGLCKGGPGRLSLPDPSPLVSVPFSCQSIMQTEGRRGEEGVWVGEISLQGGSQPGLGPGLGPGLQGRQQAPSLSPPPCSAESWGPGAEQRGWGGLIGSPAPGGSRAPRPARGAAGLCSARLSPPLPSPSPRAGNVLFPPLPPRGQRAGRAGVLPSAPHLLPAQVRAGAGALRSRATEPPWPPLTHSHPPQAGRGASMGRRAGRGARTGTPWWPCPWHAGPGPGHEGGRFFASLGPQLGEPPSRLLWIESRVAPSSLHLPPSLSLPFHLPTPLCT